MAISRLGLRIRRYFLVGLAITGPILLTCLIAFKLFQITDGFLGQLINSYLLRHYGVHYPGIGIISTVVLIVLMGVLGSHVISRWFVQFIERWFARLPLIRHIYAPAKEMAGFLFSDQPKAALRKVVLVEYPRPGLYAIGFVTNEGITKIDQATGRRLVAVLIGTTPTPLSGFTIFVPAEEIIELDMPIDQGLKLVISGGVVAPND